MPGKRKRGAQADTSKMEDQLSSLTTQEIREGLLEAGVDVGPVDPSNKQVTIHYCS